MSIGSFFAGPSPGGVGLAILFAAFWLACLYPGKWRTAGLWLVFLGGALLFAPAIAWVQVPLQNWIGNRIVGALGIFSYQQDILWAGIPVILLSGLVQEAAKLLPVWLYWVYRRMSLDPVEGLSLGAMAGAGFGLIEAQWVLNQIFASGWSWAVFQTFGFVAIAGFWERFFTLSFHTASAGLMSWGLAKGKGGQFYLLSSFLHFLLNYSILFVQKRWLTANQLEIFIAVFAILVFAAVLWLRWRKRTPDAAG
jgi:RsiW-degrading membrane proteinase PrsW (M82 family)